MMFGSGFVLSCIFYLGIALLVLYNVFASGGKTVSSVLPSDFTFRYPSVKLSQVELCCVILLCGCYHSKSKDMLWLISCSERWNLEGGTADDLAGRSMPPVPQYVGACCSN